MMRKKGQKRKENTNISKLRQYATSCLASLNCCKDTWYHKKENRKKNTIKEKRKHGVCTVDAVLRIHPMVF